jgi:hypothetical protein
MAPPLQLVIDATKESVETLTICRCIIAAAIDIDSGGEFSVVSIAERTGLTTEVVRAILASPTYLKLIQAEAAQMISHSLIRGVRRMDKILHGDRTSDANRIAAHRANVHTYQAVSYRPIKDKPPDDGGLEEWAKEARITVTNPIPLKPS